MSTNDTSLTSTEGKSNVPSEKSNLPAQTSSKKEVILPHWTKCHVSKYKSTEQLKKIPFTSSVTSHYKNPQNLMKIPYVKPFESTYEACRPLGGEGSNERLIDIMRPMHKRKTKFYIEGLRS